MEVFLIILGVVITAIGTVVFVSPLPFGFAIVIPGLALLVMSSDKIARFVFRKRDRHDELDDRMDQAEAFVPDKMSDPLKERTDPDTRSEPPGR